MHRAKKHHKERGPWLTAAIILVIIHGLLLLGISFGENSLRNIPIPGWFYLAVVGIAVADIVAGLALWRWKGWGFYLYLAASLVAMALGLLVTGSLLFIFSRIVPVAIVGYVMRPKWKYFEGL